MASVASAPPVVQATATTAVDATKPTDRFRYAHDRTYHGLDSRIPTGTIPLKRATYYAAILADPQFGFDKDNRSWDEEIVRSEIAIAALNKLQPRPAFAIVCGDLTHAYPGEYAYTQQAADYKRIYSQVSEEIPLLCLCGNHDITNRPTAASIASYVSRFGDDYYSFLLRDVSTYGIVVNSSLWRDDGNAPQLQAAQLEWFKRELARATDPSLWSPQPPQHIFVFSHHPWFLQRANEPDQYFNMPRALRDEVLKLMTSHGVRAAFAGHYHRCAGGFTEDGSLEMIVTSAVGKPLGVDPCGFRLVKVFTDNHTDNKTSPTTESKASSSSPSLLDHRYFHLDEMPTHVTLQRGTWGSESDADEPKRQHDRDAALAIDNAPAVMPPTPPGLWPPPSVEGAPRPTLGKRVLMTE